MTYTGPYEGPYSATAMFAGCAKEKGLKWDSSSTEAASCLLAGSRYTTTIPPFNLVRMTW